jgi:hypothetical protein
MNDIVKVQFTFENCEDLTYEASDIAKIELYDIAEQFVAAGKKISRRRYNDSRKKSLNFIFVTDLFYQI